MGEIFSPDPAYGARDPRTTRSARDRRPKVPLLGELPEAPAAPPRPPDATDLAVRAARNEELRRGRRLGHRSTILTGPLGAPGKPLINGKTLLGS